MEAGELNPGDLVTNPSGGVDLNGGPYTCEVEAVRVYKMGTRAANSMGELERLEPIAFFTGGGFWRVSQLRKVEKI